MEKHNIHYGTQKMAERRFRLFLGVALILLSVLWAELGNRVSMEPNAFEIGEVGATFGETAKGIFRALTETISENGDAKGKSISPASEE